MCPDSQRVSRTNSLLLCPERRERYNERSIDSILYYATALQNKTFEEILIENNLSEEDIIFLREKSMTNKGLLGNLIEQAYFGYPSNSRQEADFPEVGLELKSTPYDGEGDAIRPGETLSLTQINYREPQEENYYLSHVWEKMQKILIVYYHRERERARRMQSKLFYSISYVFMLRPDARDLAIIEADYRMLVGYMTRGEAHLLSRTHGEYLGVAPKSSRREYVEQYYGEHIPALKRGYVLKIPYLTYILRRAAGLEEDPGETIISDISVLQEKSLADILEERVRRFIDMKKEDIWELVKRPDEGDLPPSKNEDAVLSCRMLGVKSNRVEEFTRAGILPKVIKYRKVKGKNQQFRLEDFRFMQLFNEEPDFPDMIDDGERHGWEASKLFSYLADRQYLFMVFWETDKGTIFKGCQLWGISDRDLEIVHDAWVRTKIILGEGVKLIPKIDRNGNVSVQNNLPGIADNGVFHIRPHTSKAFYVIDGREYGNGSITDTDLLPNGDRITKQAYWLNRSFIDSQLRPELVMSYR